MSTSKCSTYYLAGPMTGYPQFNFPAFEQAAWELRTVGHKIISPHELDTPEVQAEAKKSMDGKLDSEGKIAGMTWADILSKDVKVVADHTDGVVVLPGWDKSKGATLEVFVAITVGHKLFQYAPGVPERMLPMSYATAMQAIQRRVFNF
jgi:hypothetical protein